MMPDDSNVDEEDEFEQPPMPRASGRPLVTWALLVVNLVVWLAATAAGGSEDRQVLLDYGAMFGPLIADGQYWRLFTAMFLHVGIAHLAFNGFGLFVFGYLVEGAYGHARFLLVYVLAGLSGSVASYLLNSIAVGAGASGAVFGVLGALTAFFAAQRRVLGPTAARSMMGLLVLVGIHLVYGFINPGIDNIAHLGGFVGGVALGLALAPSYTVVTSPFGVSFVQRDSTVLAGRWWVVPVAVAVLVAGTALATATLQDNSYTHLYRAEDHFAAGEVPRALEETEAAVLLDEGLAEAYYLRARILVSLGDQAAARRELVQAISYADRSDSGGRRTFNEALDLLQRLRSG
jgi:membrane associated rhomboid family serine protease